jgi:lipid-binding SYLF domain-containing protein
MPLDKECQKAAAILRTFTREGFQVKTKERNGNNTKSMVKVPQNVLQQAKGLAIFTVFRTGFQISGAGGSGILIARQPDGSEFSINKIILSKSI